MPRKTAASHAPGHAALACGNTACGKALGPPLLQCFKCKAEAWDSYCWQLACVTAEVPMNKILSGREFSPAPRDTKVRR